MMRAKEERIKPVNVQRLANVNNELIFYRCFVFVGFCKVNGQFPNKTKRIGEIT